LHWKNTGEAHQAEPVDAESVDSAVTALAGDVHAVEVCLAQQPPGEPLKGVRCDVHELFE
jgi:hypothetical protein